MSLTTRFAPILCAGLTLGGCVRTDKDTAQVSGTTAGAQLIRIHSRPVYESILRTFRLCDAGGQRIPKDIAEKVSSLKIAGNLDEAAIRDLTSSLKNVREILLDVVDKAAPGGVGARIVLPPQIREFKVDMRRYDLTGDLDPVFSRYAKADRSVSSFTAYLKGSDRIDGVLDLADEFPGLQEIKIDVEVADEGQARQVLGQFQAMERQLRQKFGTLQKYSLQLWNDEEMYFETRARTGPAGDFKASRFGDLQRLDPARPPAE